MRNLFLLLIALVTMSACQKPQSEITKITYEAGPCFGFCPNYKMTLLPDRSAIIEAERFTFSSPETKDWNGDTPEGTFKTVLSEASMQNVLKHIDKAHLERLGKKYGNYNITDLPTAYLTIQYSNGQQKHIEDYGKKGTMELAELYKVLESLRETEKWEKVN